MSLDVKFSATDAGFTSTVSKVKTSVKSMDDSVAKTASSVQTSFGSMVKAGAALALGFGAIKLAANAISGTFSTFKDALDLGGELSDLSDQTGETAGNLLVLQRAFDNSGVGADKVGTSINKIQKALVEASQGSDQAREKFNAIGLSWSELATKSPTEQLRMIAKAISELPTPAERAAASMEFFGKSGGRSLAFLKDFDGAVADAKGELGTMPDVMDENARVFDTISDKITKIGGKFKEFAAGVLGEMTPMLETITTALAGIDMAGFGKRLAQAFIGGTAAMDGFTSALSALKVGEFSLAFEMAWASIKLQAKQTANEIYRNMVAAFSAAAEFLTDVLGPYSAIYATISNAFVVLGKSLASSIASSLTPIFEALPVIGTGIGESMREAVKNLDGELDRATKRMNAYGGMIKDDLTDAGKAFPESFKSAYEATQPFINVQDDMKEVDRLAGEINKTAAGLTWNMMSQVEELPQLTWNMKDHMKEGAGAMEEAAKTVKETLSLSEEIVKRIKEAQGKEAVDKGGKLEKAATEAIEERDFDKAERIRKKIKGKEEDVAIREEFGGDKKTAKSIRDMAKEAGIDITKKSNKELKDELTKRTAKAKDEMMKKRQEEMKPGEEGKKEGKPGEAKKEKEQSFDPLQKAVDAILALVQKIEPKLPTAALGA